MPEAQTLLTEVHPLEPFLPPKARLLMLGSFPPRKVRWAMDFYYPNPLNDMWRIMGLVFYSDRDYFLVAGEKRFDESSIRDFCAERGIALTDTARAVRRLRGNASDNYLQIVEPLDLGAVLSRLPDCRAIAATGQKAAETLAGLTDTGVPAIGGFTEWDCGDRNFALYRMPSSSRAYPLPLADKARYYAEMFRRLGMT